MKKRSAFILFFDSEKLLLLQKQKDSRWVLPGGKKNQKETYLETAIRETVEEIGFIPKAEINKFINLFDKKSECKIYFCKIDNNFACNLSKEHKKYKWIKARDTNKLCLKGKLKIILKKIKSKINFR